MREKSENIKLQETVEDKEQAPKPEPGTSRAFQPERMKGRKASTLNNSMNLLDWKTQKIKKIEMNSLKNT